MNQSNLREKAVQIPNLFRILSKVEEVVGWLGHHGQFTHYATTFMTKEREMDFIKENYYSQAD